MKFTEYLDFDYYDVSLDSRSSNLFLKKESIVFMTWGLVLILFQFPYRCISHLNKLLTNQMVNIRPEVQPPPNLTEPL